MNKLSFLALIVPLAAACGGQIFLDSEGNGTGGDGGTGNPGKDAAGGIDASGPSNVCGSTPEVVTSITGDVAHVDSLAISATSVFYTVSNIDVNDPKDPLMRGLHRVDLAAKTDVALVDHNTRRGAIAASFAVIGDSAYFTAPKILPNDGQGPHRVNRIPIAGGDAVDAFDAEANANYGELSASPSGVLFGQSTPVTAGFDSAWSWKAGSSKETNLEFTFLLKKHRAFDGGFAGVKDDGAVWLGLESNMRGILVRAPAAGRTVRSVRPLREQGSFVSIYAMDGVSGGAVHTDRIVRDPCVTGIDGSRNCGDAVDKVVYAVPANIDLVDFDIRQDGSLIVSQVDVSGLRPAPHLVWVRDQGVEVIGGEGINGTVLAITALETRGTCVYWAEKRSDGAKIMRVSR